ncbi:hypothetical protein HPB50_020152 [Hyalomma asiaticum]|uniref:Uncharacterized protein n=1 Tax=Hyalomma asiaticum TaxID=266040 RepID=A0ACB7TKZ5_HYAAI|nr:hypothetical protein HPB50_020152 [Hyalomma asiaticum]
MRDSVRLGCSFWSANGVAYVMAQPVVPAKKRAGGGGLPFREGYFHAEMGPSRTLADIHASARTVPFAPAAAVLVPAACVELRPRQISRTADPRHRRRFMVRSRCLPPVPRWPLPLP